MPAPQRRFRTSPHPTVEVQGTRTTTARRGTRDVVHDETEHTEVLDSTRFRPGEEPAHVKFGAGLTINLQNYESLRLDVAVILPCLPSELHETFEAAVDFVSEKLTEEKSKWLG